MNCRCLLSLALAAAAVAAMPARADVDLSRLGLSRAQVQALNAQLTAPAVAPGIAFGSPVAFGAGLGQAFFAIGGQTVPPNHSREVDGAMTLGFGLFDAERYVGLETTLTAISVIEGTARDGNVNFKLHRVLPGRSAVAIGTDNTFTWGDARGTDDATYVAYTKVVDLSASTPKTPWSLAMNVGLGDGRFVDPGDDGLGVFGSVAVAPVRRLSLILDWSGRDANAAISVVPLRRWPVVITVGAINLAERNGQDIEFAGGAGWLWTF